MLLRKIILFFIQNYFPQKKNQLFAFFAKTNRIRVIIVPSILRCMKNRKDKFQAFDFIANILHLESLSNFA